MFVPPVAKPQARGQTRSTPGPAGGVMGPRPSQSAPGFCDDQKPESALREGTAWGTTRGATWDFGGISLFPPGRSHSPPALQPKLAVGPAADPLEQEADRVAEQVMRMPADNIPATGISAARGQPRISRKCAACQEEETLQRTAAGSVGTAPGEAPGIVHEVLQSPGQALDPSSRTFFEPRFGQDFGHVRVHADGRAARSAQAVNALAYASGPNIVFADGRYSPGSGEGRRLLAHELAHVVQQSAAPSSSFQVQRQPDKDPKETPKETPKQKPEPKPKPRQDIALLGEGWTGGRELAIVLAHGGRVIRVNSVADAAQALAKIDAPIGTLYFVTHSTSDGALKFGKDEGFTKAADIAKKLKGSVPADKAPKTVDFRGCSVGNSPQAMEDIRTALGANSVVAGNCYAVIALSTPLKMGEKDHETEVTNALQVPKTSRRKFEELYKATREKMVASVGSKTSCIVTKSENDFFAAGGRFVALWFNSSFSGKWIKDKSVCYADATRQTVDPSKPAAAIPDCSVITVNAPTPATTPAPAPAPKAAETKP